MRDSRGFTLIEIMIVLFIVAMAVTMSLPYISNRNTQTKAFLREMIVLTRELHTKAKLHGATYRLVIEMPADDGRERRAQVLWVEKSNGKAVLSDREEERWAERQRESDEKKKVDPKGFEMDPSFFKEPRQLPSGLRFDRVELTRLKNPVVNGRAFIHFLPQGLVDEAALHIKGEGTQAWTIAIHPLTGRAELIAKPLSLKEIKSQ